MHQPYRLMVRPCTHISTIVCVAAQDAGLPDGHRLGLLWYIDPATQRIRLEAHTMDPSLSFSTLSRFRLVAIPNSFANAPDRFTKRLETTLLARWKDTQALQAEGWVDSRQHTLFYDAPFVPATAHARMAMAHHSAQA